MTNPSTNYGLTKESTLIPKLTTLTNQRVTSSTLTVSDLIPLADQSTSLGLSRTSTLVLDPPVNYGDITITQPGQYLPSDFNSQGLYDPTQSAGFEYINQINVNVSPKKSISLIQSQYNGTIAKNDTNSNWRFLSNSQSISIQRGYSILSITNSSNKYVINYRFSITSTTNYSFNSNCWVFISNSISYSTDINFYDSNSSLIFGLKDSFEDDIGVTVNINSNFIDFSGINWMTFN